MSGEKTDHHTIDKPLEQTLPHGRRSAWPHRQKAYWAAFQFFDDRRRFHFLERKMRKEISRAGRHTSVSQCISHTFFIRQLAVITSVIREHHVHNGAGEKNHHSRKDNGKPQGG